MGEFVYESLQKELILRPSYRCPWTVGYVCFPAVIIKELVCGAIGKLMKASDGLLITRIRRFNPNNAGMKRGRHAVRSQRAAEPGYSHGAVSTVLHRFLTAPDHLYGTSHLLRDDNRQPDVVVGTTAAEAASQKTIVEVYVLFRNAGQLGYLRHCFFRILRSYPHFCTISGDMSGTVHRLHHGVIHIRQFVYGFHDLSGAVDNSFGVS